MQRVQDVPVNVTTKRDLERLYQQGDRIWGAILAYAGDPEVANDAVAEAFAQALRKGEAIRRPERWVWRAVFRIAAGELKDRRRRSELGAASLRWLPTSMSPWTRMPSQVTSPFKEAAIAGTWEGTWSSSEFDMSGTFTMTFEETGDGFTGTIQIQGSDCVTDGQVTAAVDGTAITIGAVQAEQEIAFACEVSDGAMSGTYSSPAGCGDDSGTWEATLAG